MLPNVPKPLVPGRVHEQADEVLPGELGNEETREHVHPFDAGINEQQEGLVGNVEILPETRFELAVDVAREGQLEANRDGTRVLEDPRELLKVELLLRVKLFLAFLLLLLMFKFSFLSDGLL